MPKTKDEKSRQARGNLHVPETGLHIGGVQVITQYGHGSMVRGKKKKVGDGNTGNLATRKTKRRDCYILSKEKIHPTTRASGFNHRVKTKNNGQSKRSDNTLG